MSADDDVVEEGPAEIAAEAVIVEDDDQAALPKRARWLEDGSITLQLRFPVVMKLKSSATGQTREERTGELVFKRLTGAQLLEAQSSSGQFMRILLARSTGMTEAKARGLLDRMDASDALAAMQVVGIFTGSGPTTGL